MEERNSSDWQADSTLVSLLEAISEAHISHRSRYRIVRIVRASYYTATQQYICVVHLGIQLGNHTSPPFITEYSNQQWNCTSIKCSSQHSYQNVQSIYIRGWTTTTVLTLTLAVHPTNKHQSTITLAKYLLQHPSSLAELTQFLTLCTDVWRAASSSCHSWGIILCSSHNMVLNISLISPALLSSNLCTSTHGTFLIAYLVS